MRSAAMSDDETDGPWGMHIHDSRDLKSYLATRFDSTEGLVDTIVTSPPYGDIEDYGDQEDQVGQQGYEGFLSDLTEIFRQCYDIAADDATLWIITDTFRRENRLIRLPFDIADELENLLELEYCQSGECNTPLQRDRESGELYCPNCEATYNPLTDSWRLMDNIIWDKKRTRSWYSRGQLRNVHEHISVYNKSDGYTYNLDSIRITDTDQFGRWWVNYPERYSPKGMAPENIWEYEIPKQGQWGPKMSYHPSPFPVGLVERIIKLATDEGDVVLDPFAGVGTTLAIAEGLDRKALGFELNEEFKHQYENHVRPEITEKMWFSSDGDTSRQEHLRHTIWALRIHKYAFELYKQLVRREETPHGPGDFYYILVSADKEELVNKDTDVGATIHYILDDTVKPDSLPIETARDELISDDPGSGDYYEVDFTTQALTISDYQNQLTDDGLCANTDEIYFYLGGRHYWYDLKLPVTQWHESVMDATKYEYREENWIPLVSNQAVQVDNPMVSKTGLDTDSQRTLESYESGNGDS